MSELDKNPQTPEQDNADDQPQGLPKGRIFLWVGAGLVGLYFIGQGVWGLMFGEADADPAGLATTSVSAFQLG
ncbi:hypothetical protein V5R04_10995 [Jonesiaceae bacterium BS-20]|uniref:Uncharacterized protein n=1 Tax=Jonesiaceae bacterium BS-20 TaxID=3120821 RepID=A0AAU7DTY0_9MICO